MALATPRMPFRRSAVLVVALLLAASANCAPEVEPDFASPEHSDQPLDPATLSPYRPNALRAPVLVACVTAGECTFEKLPLIGMEAGECANPNDCAPTIDTIMDRVVVSDPWMGKRFEELLPNLSPDILLLLRATTAIVIAADVRPSHHAFDTAAIYLDPQLFWLSPEERETIDLSPDYRSDYGAGLSFARHWRYVINGKSAWTRSEDPTLRRAQMPVELSWLLYHELAHANDCFHPANIDRLLATETPMNNMQQLYGEGRCLHQQLSDRSSLSEYSMYDLAAVLHWGQEADTKMASMSGQEAGALFQADKAIDTYSYTTDREDVATAFGALMMKANFGADRDMIFATKEGESCDKKTVFWGQRGRLGRPDILDRSVFVASKILPDKDFSELTNGLPLPTAIDSLCLPGDAKAP